MPKPAFSTVACPDWTLERVARSAAEHGFAGVELRSFGEGGTELACDPGLTDGAKTHALFRDVGVAVAGVSTGVSFDAPIFPPVAGRLLPSVDASVHEGRAMVDVASRCRAGYLRVYAYDVPGRESRRSAARRIADRLSRVCDHARNRDVRVVLENGGGFSSWEHIADLARRVLPFNLGVCYDLAAAVAAGDDWERGLQELAPSLVGVRVKDLRNGEACPLGEGELPCEAFVRAVARFAPDAWVVHTWDKLWDTSLPEADAVLPATAARLYEWSGPGGSASDAAA